MRIIGRNFGRNFLREIFWVDFFMEVFFERNYLVEINKELVFLSRFWGNFVSMHKEGRRKEEFLILRSTTQAHRT